MSDARFSEDDLPEVPTAVVDNVASWRQVMATTRDEIVRDVLRNAASDLFQTRKINKNVHPETDGIVNQAIADGLHEMAQAAGIGADDAQLIFSEAQQAGAPHAMPPEQMNGHAAVAQPTAATTKKDDPTRRFRLEMLDEIALADDPVELIQGLLPMGPALGVVFGPPKSLKSFLLKHVGLHVADSRSFCGRTVQGGAVVYVTSEGIRGVKRRLIAARRAMDIEGRNVPFALVPTMPNLGAGEADRAVLQEAIAEALANVGVPLRLIVIDTLRRAMPGKSENEQKDVSIVVDNCEALARAFGCLVILVHHSPRSDDQRGSGSNAVDAAADLMWSIIRPDESRRSATATVVRYKDGEEGDTWTFELRPAEIGTDRNGTPITSCSVEVTIEPERKIAAAKSYRLSPAQQRVFDILLNASIEAGTTGLAGVAAPRGTRAVTRDMLKAYAKKSGWWDAEDDKSSRTRFSARLNELAGKHAIGLSAEHVWPARGVP
jgi:hypothetical protein